jgi:sodium/proline symporter
MTRSATVLLTLLTFAAAVLVVAAWAGRRTHGAADFAVANRRLGVWLLALGYASAAINPWTLLILGASAFTWGLAAVWIWAALVFGCIVHLWFVAPRLRAISAAQGTFTLTQVISAESGDRLQPLVVRSATAIGVVLLLLQTTVLLRAAGGFLVDDFGFSLERSIILSVLLVTACVFAGGLRAVSACDALATVLVLLVAGFLILPAIAAGGSIEELRAAFSILGPEASDWFAGKRGVVAVALVAGAAGLGLAMTGQPQAAARLMAAKDDATVNRARWLALAAVAISAAAVIFCAWCASVLYAGLERPELALPAIATRILPPSLAAILVLCLMFSIVLNIGGQLFAIATSFAVDLRRTSVPLSLPWMRAALLLAAVLCICAGLYAGGDLHSRALFAFTALGASFGPLLLVRVSGKRIRPGSALGAMWAGFVLSVLFHLLPDAPGDFLERVLPFIAALGIALTGGERRRNPDRADRSQETVHDRVPI